MTVNYEFAQYESIPISSTPMPSYSERETIFTGIRKPDYVYPDPFESPLSPDPICALPLWPDQSPRASSPLHEQRLPHWILHPKLLGIPIQVVIIGGESDTSMKKGGIFVKTINSVNGINVVCQHFGQTISVPYYLCSIHLHCLVPRASKSRNRKSTRSA